MIQGTIKHERYGGLSIWVIFSEVEWLKDLLSDFSFVPKPILPISVHTDSRSTIEILKQDNANKKMNRHIQIRLKSVVPIGQSCASRLCKVREEYC